MNDVVNSGALPVAVLVAALAGLVSFASPCVLPLVPGYLGYVTGVSDTSLADRSRWRMVVGALLFVLGFTAVFVLGTVFVAGVGVALVEHRALLGRIGGGVLILMALVFAGVGSDRVQRSVRLPVTPTSGLVGAPLLGAVFGLGWAPCIGPTLAAVLTLAVAGPDPDTGRAAVLAVAYCLGLGLPFVLAALLWERWLRISGGLRRHTRAVQLIGAGLLALLGVLLLTGLWDDATVWLQGRFISTWEAPL